jgi:two-component system OmpR family sensor kinase
MSLRLRLTIALTVFVAVGLFVMGTLTYRSLDTFLLGRVDQQLQSARGAVAFALSSGAGEPPAGMGMVGPGLGQNEYFPMGTVGEVVAANGKATYGPITYTYGDVKTPLPSLPHDVVTATHTTSVTVSAVGDRSFKFRVLAQPLQNGAGTFIVAIPLTDVVDTLHRLLVIEALVAASVLLGLALLTWVTIRRELKPLRDMASTAGAIAGGDLSERVASTDPRTEVGSLGVALNSMLGQIEGAFAEREASEERLRRFLADASHELRTPLTSIRGYSELYRRTAGSDPIATEDSMRRIEEEAARMGVLVDDLLLLARLDQGRPLHFAEVDLARIATDAAADARAVDPSREISCDAPDAAPLEGDETRLRQVVGNLFANALKHTPAGTPVNAQVRAGGDHVVLEVADRGPGLSDHDRGEIFEPFYRSDPARARDSGGAGLGLAIVAAIVRAHGGDVEAEDREGGGALFRVSLPRTQPQSAPAPAPVDSQEIPIEA